MRFAGLLAVLAISLPATTLEQLSLDDMIGKSTAIVHGRVGSSYAVQQGPLIYTHFTIQVLERWKGPASAQVDVAVPGGTLGAKRQTVAGAPALESGTEYVFFLWTGKSGVSQIIGLSQGVMSLQTNTAGEQYVARAAASEPMTDSAGKAVTDTGFQMRLRDLASRVSRSPASGSTR